MQSKPANRLLLRIAAKGGGQNRGQVKLLAVDRLLANVVLGDVAAELLDPLGLFVLCV